MFPLKVEIEHSKLVLDDKGEVLHAFLTSDDKWRMETELHEITPDLAKAFINKEDRFFYSHPGVNPLAIGRAVFNNLIKGERTSGASTITMQVARMLEPKRRTYLNKAVEIFRAFQLETRYSKKEILQLYLNLVPYGSNIEGVKSASVLFFDKLPDHLSLAELTTLAVVPNKPNTWALRENNTELIEGRNRWLKRFRARRVFEAKRVEDALDEPYTAKRRDGPKSAPHFAHRVKNFFPRNNIHTHINRETQVKIESITRSYVNSIKGYNIQNAAVLVIENETGKVIAYVGSADFNNRFDGGQVDGIRAIRSPGSTLKPVLYAMSIDEGLYTMNTKLADVPVDFEGYQPENYYQDFNGWVTLEYALEQSLNIPAVKILNQITVEEFLKLLVELDFETIRKQKEILGLSTILGGCGVSLEELTNTYAMLARQGVYQTLDLAKGGIRTPSKRILSAPACFMVTEVMTQLVRPDLPKAYVTSTSIPRIAWKTGTSYGRKDAWSIGYNRTYTVGVWVGNFSGQGVPELNGAAIATPLLFKVFNAIDYNSPADWYTLPDGTDIRHVCSETGLPPNEFCKNTVMDYFIPGTSPANICEHLIAVEVSPDGSFSYCRSCKPETGYKKELYPNLSPEMITYNRTYQIPYKVIPPHNPSCTRVFSEEGPEITSPSDGQEYLLMTGEEQKIKLECHVQGNVQHVYWYINDQFLKKARPDEVVFFTPQAGTLKISCADDKGRNNDVRIEVEYY